MSTVRRAQEPRFTYGDYRQWDGDDRWELIDGHPFAMSPAPSRLHQQVVGQLHAQIAVALRGHRCAVYVAPFDVRLPAADEDDNATLTVVQPDISVVCDPRKLDDAGCRGAPDWIVEVLSPRTALRDHIVKRDLYARAGVRAYWLLDPDARTLTVYLRDEAAGGFAPPSVEAAAGTRRAEVVDHLDVDWSLVFA